MEALFDFHNQLVSLSLIEETGHCICTGMTLGKHLLSNISCFPRLSVSFKARGPALPTGCALIVVTQSLYVCGHFWFSYQGGESTELSQKIFTRKIFRPF